VATTSFAMSLAEKNQPITMPAGLQHLAVIDGSLLFEDLDIGHDEIWADWSSLKVCYYYPGHASVMCVIKECSPNTGKGWRRCPRSRLAEFVNATKSQHDLDFLFGMEIEFYIMDESSGSPQPVKMVQTTWSTASFNNKYILVVEEIVKAISNAGIPVRQYHSEGAPGLFEFSLEPLPPVEAADSLIYCHEAIKSICMKNGLRGTLFPEPFEKLATVGAHYHMSVSKTGKEDHFLAGLLKSWKALAAFYMPNFDSHLRVGQGMPNKRIFWSNFKIATIRRCEPGHWELRTIDATANPYLTMFAVLSAGMLGWESEMELTMKDPNKPILNRIEDKEAEELGITDTMPMSLKEALDTLKADKSLVDAIGPEIIERYLRVKTKEEEGFSKMTASERREMSMRLF
jgi:glutamine synthetase